MFKLIVYYGLIVLLSVFLITPLILQWFLKKVLKKFNFNIKIVGLLTYHNIRMQLRKANTVFQSLNLSIGSITVKKTPKRFAFTICVNKITIQLGYRPLDLFFTGNISNLQRIAANTSDHEQIMQNSEEILNFVREIYLNQPKLKKPSSKGKSNLKSSESKKKSINDNPEFFKQMFVRIILMIVMKLLVVEITECELEVIRLGNLKKNEHPKPMLKLEVTRYLMEFEYQKVTICPLLSTSNMI